MRDRADHFFTHMWLFWISHYKFVDMVSVQTGVFIPKEGLLDLGPFYTAMMLPNECLCSITADDLFCAIDSALECPSRFSLCWRLHSLSYSLTFRYIHIASSRFCIVNSSATSDKTLHKPSKQKSLPVWIHRRNLLGNYFLPCFFP